MYILLCAVALNPLLLQTLKIVLPMPYAIVTGATKGIGRAVAEKLLQEGCHVALCARSLQDLQQLKTQWTQQFQQAQILIQAVDVRDKQAVQNFGRWVCAQWARVDILVNNVGVFLPGNLCEEPEQRLEETMKTNVYSAYHLTRIIAPLMKAQQKGHIFNICSAASLKAYPMGGSYSISKYALLGFSDNLRQELMPWHIKVTALSPGAVWSHSWEGSGKMPEQMMSATDIAALIWAAFSLSEQANVENIMLRPLQGDL
jgi:NADP-dependent 3-hydroxy acid dehydrogenase YdfG